MVTTIIISIYKGGSMPYKTNNFKIKLVFRL